MGAVTVRCAAPADIDALLALYEELADKATAAPGARERSEAVLAEILADPARHLMVALLAEEPVGSADLIVAANLTHGGAPWAIVENVIVAESARRRGIARELMEHVIGLAGAAGCYKVQLLSGMQREEAHRLYSSLGFAAIAQGFKLYLE
jgi:GNAT superfamily N-acetyltransferase